MTKSSKSSRNTTKKTTELLLTTKDAVFGRGRKRDHVRKGSLYRHLIEMYWLPYSELDTSKFAMRRAFVKAHILDVLMREGGRFIVRSGSAKILLDPTDPTDLKLIFKKVQRALFNEKKRQEMKQGVSFASKNLAYKFTEGEDPEDFDMPVPVSPLSAKIKMEDFYPEEEEEDSDEEEEDLEDDDLIHPEEISSGVATRSKGLTCATLIPEEEDCWDFKSVNVIRTKMETALYAPQEEEEEAELVAEEEDDAAMVEATKVAMVAEDCNGRRSSDKLDFLAELATSLLGKQGEVEDGDKKMPAKDNSVMCDVSVVDESKPLKKRTPRFQSYKAFEDEMMVKNEKVNGAPSKFSDFMMEARLALKPRIGDFEQHCHEFGSI